MKKLIMLVCILGLLVACATTDAYFNYNHMDTPSYKNINEKHVNTTNPNIDIVWNLVRKLSKSRFVVTDIDEETNIDVFFSVKEKSVFVGLKMKF